VADVGVYGVPDARRGEAPKAAVVLTAPGAATADELEAWVAERLAGYKHIDRFVFVDEIPRTASGKVLRRTLKERDPDAANP
jgi:long-chain acyl-CoA synthetase